jgi:capsular polysaccharide biosynthesis protein
MLATAGTMGLVLVSEKFDSRIRTEEQVEQTLQIPVLAAVPEGRLYGGIPAANG